MDNLIDKTYFIGPLSIAQLSQKSVVDSLNSLIAFYQKDFLEAALGYELYKAFEEGVDVGSDETIDQKWLNLLTGVEFTSLDDRKLKFEGFQPVNKSQFSALVCYIYEQFLRDQNTQVTGVGTVQSQAENAIIATSSVRLTEVHNKMSDQIHILWEFLRANEETYPEWKPENICGMRIISWYPFYRTYGGKGMFNRINQFGI